MTIEVNQLGKKYGRHQAIAEISFDVQSGEVMGLLGVNGAGKTTIMRILAGALRPSSGTATIAGHDIQTLAARKQVGYLPETVPLYREMLVRDFLEFTAALGQVPGKHRQQYAQRSIERCGLQEYQHSPIFKLSQGYRQRLGIAQAIVHNPPVIILDEPTRGLDPNQIISIRKLIQELATDHTILLSSHILAEVQITCQRVTIVHQGRVIAIDRPEQLAKILDKSSSYELECSGEATAIQKILQDLPTISSVTILPSNTPGRSLLAVAAVAAEDIGADLVTALVAQGIPVHEIRRQRANLEDVFLDLTKSSDAKSQDLGGE
jgi:ABC-2 type transport system ATP-binding protein